MVAHRGDRRQLPVLPATRCIPSMTLDTVVRCRFLGQAQIEIGHTLVTPEAERLFALLMVLACEAGRTFNRSELVTLLWPDVSEDKGKHSLRQSIYKARQAGAPFETAGEEIRFTKHAVYRDWDEPRMPVHGEWLGAYTAAFSDALAVWVLGRRATIHAGLRPRMIAHMQAVRSSGDIHEAGRLAEQILRIDPLNEEAVLVTAESYAMAGAKIDALRLLDEYIEEVGRVSDSPELLMPAKILRFRIAEKLPISTYSTGEPHELSLVGRERQFKQLVAALFDVRGKRGATTWLWGSEGIGKSRLISEQLKVATLQGIRVVRERYPTGESKAGGHLVGLLKRLLDTPGALGSDPATLANLKRVADGSAAPQSNDLRSGMVELIHAIAEEQPLYIVLDGADNWLPDELNLMSDIVSGLRNAEAGLLISTRRSPRTLGAELSAATTTLPLAPLSRDEIQEIVELRSQQLKREPDSATVLGAAVLSAGIPGFAIELLGKALNPADGDVLPHKIRRALFAAVSSLTIEQRQIVAAIWAAGPDAPVDTIAECAGVEPYAVHAAVEMLLELNLVIQQANGYSVVAPVEPVATELVPQVCTASFLVSCARVLRHRAKNEENSDALFRAYFLLAKASHKALAANWASEDLSYILSNTSATSILRSIHWLDQAVGLDDELAVFAGIGDEVRLRGGDYSTPSNVRFTNERLASVLPSTPAEEIAYYNKCVGSREYESAMRIAGDVTRVHVDRVRAATQAIVIGDNLQEVGLVSQAAEILDVLSSATQHRSIDIVRGRLIAACVMHHNEQIESECSSLAALAQEEPDRSESCKALRTVFHAKMALGDLSRARTAILESLLVARQSEFWNHVVMGELCLAFLAIAQLNGQSADAHLREASAISRLHTVNTPLILFDNQLAAVWCRVLADDLAEAQKEMRRLEQLAPESESNTTLRQLTFLRFALLKDRTGDECSAIAVRLASSLGSHRPDDREDRNAFLLKVAVDGTAYAARVGDLLAKYVEKKISLGYQLSPMAESLSS